MTVETLKLIHNDESYDNFWKTTTEKAKTLDIGEPSLRKVPARYQDGTSSGHFHDNPVAHYRQAYFEALDLIINCIEDRFDQPGFRIYQSIQSLLVKACKQKEWGSDLESACETYKDDFDKEVLRTQLGVLGANFEKSTDTITII